MSPLSWSKPFTKQTILMTIFMALGVIYLIAAGWLFGVTVFNEGVKESAASLIRIKATLLFIFGLILISLGIILLFKMKISKRIDR
ncbi:MAG: hypothetical protein DRZ82_05115 [Thermoprotei archaeon]|nr:MAG: hypothetical protein DRZ82_05115 [Thermoprotei archaeon]